MNEVKLLEVYRLLSEVSTLWYNNGGDADTQAMIDAACCKVHDSIENLKTMTCIVEGNNAQSSNATERY
jgi:hypothetical protein